MSKDSNLEFRKVPSLNFLYEISEDGRFLRNVKSKKYMMSTKRDSDYVFPKLNVKKQDLLDECWPRKQTRVIVNSYECSSINGAALYIARLADKNPNTIRSKLKQRRKHIYGYKITYLNAETGHAGPKGQGTVH